MQNKYKFAERQAPRKIKKDASNCSKNRKKNNNKNKTNKQQEKRKKKTKCKLSELLHASDLSFYCTREYSKKTMGYIKYVISWH